MNDKKKEKYRKQFTEAGLMAPEDVIVDYIQGNHFDTLVGRMGVWKQGWICFTQERIIYPTGILDEDIIIPYRSIRGLRKCSQGLFPMGIEVAYDNAKTGKQENERFSVSKRAGWLDFLSSKSGVAHD